MDFPKPYRLADIAVRQLNRSIVRRFEQTKQALVLAKFDELSVYKQIGLLYEQLDEDNRKKFRELFIARYREMFPFFGRKAPDEDTLDELADLYLSGLLSESNDLTHYIYNAETLRKRDRAIEAVNSVPNSSEKDYEFEKAMRYWSQQTGFYIDIVADDAALDAMKKCGVKRVQWVTQTDERVCKDCENLNGKIFDIDKVPPKPHVRCRCWLKPVKTKGD